jgi:phosphate acetyltransferase
MMSSAPFECPPGLLRRAQQHQPLKTAVVSAGTKRVLASAKLATEHNLIEPILVGDSSVINSIAATINWDIGKFTVVDVGSEIKAAKLSMSLARSGEVLALMKGHIHSETLMHEALQRKQGIRLKRRPSHAFYMTVPGNKQGICITDAVINVLPRVKQKIEIARNVIELMHALENPKPRIALISGTEVSTPEMPSSMDAAEVVKEVENGSLPGAEIAGPMALDVAISEQAATIKGVNNAVAGKADVLLVPNLEAGNILFKQMVYSMSATAAGLVLGMKVPIMLTSRADPPEARLASAALASVYAAHRGL